MPLTNDSYPISLASLQLNTSLDFDLYIKSTEGDGFVLYRHRDLPFTEEVRTRLLAAGVLSLYVSLDDRPRYLAYVERHLKALIADESVPVSQKARLTYDVATLVVEDILRTTLTPQGVRRSQAVAAGTGAVVALGKDAVHELVRLMPLDYKLHTHATNVSVLATALLIELGISDRSLVHAIAFAGLLHDIGETAPPLRKHPDDAESPNPGDHAVLGAQMLEQHGITDPAILRAVREHHERFDGRGLPDSIEGEEISLLARIISVADWFDNLTTSYDRKPRNTSLQAAKIIIEQMQGFFDPVVVRRLILMLGPVAEKREEKRDPVKHA
ncbi:MAG: HD domain-containing phosphohydrolase [Planctomycetota bacterium]